VSIIFVPYHLDEYLPDLNIPMPPGVDVTTVARADAGAGPGTGVGDAPGGDVWARLGSLYGAVAGAVERTARGGAVPTVVSGDCTVSLGIVAGLQRAGVDAAIVWFDAHGDVQTLETTASGYLGGMPLRILVGYRPELVSERLGLRAVPEDRVVLVDARDLDVAEVEYLASAPIRRCGVHELSAALLPAGPLVLHLDLDVVDSEELPGLRYPAPGGPTTSAVLAAADRVLDTGRVCAVSIACSWHPGQGDPTGTRSRLLSALARPR
jgi:arginase